MQEAGVLAQLIDGLDFGLYPPKCSGWGWPGDLGGISGSRQVPWGLGVPGAGAELRVIPGLWPGGGVRRGHDRRKAALKGADEGPQWGRDESAGPMGGPGGMCHDSGPTGSAGCWSWAP